jgi:hypothetical protein
MLRVAALSSELAAEAQAKAAVQQQQLEAAAECAALKKKLAAAQQKTDQVATDAAAVQIDLHKSRAQQRWVCVFICTVRRLLFELLLAYFIVPLFFLHLTQVF